MDQVRFDKKVLKLACPKVQVTAFKRNSRVNTWIPSPTGHRVPMPRGSLGVGIESRDQCAGRFLGVRAGRRNIALVACRNLRSCFRARWRYALEVPTE